MKKLGLKTLDYIIIVFILGLGFLVRYSVLGYMSGDYLSFLRPWTELVRAEGVSNFFINYHSDYTAPYLYFISIVAQSDGSPLILLKLISIFFDYVCAVLMFVFLFDASRNKWIAVIGLFAVLFWPTVVLNGAVWCQCDIIYTTFIMASIYQICRKKFCSAFVFWGIAFTFKLQAVFFLPVLVIACILNWRRIRYFIFPVLTYVVMGIPALIFGADAKKIYGVYFLQVGEYTENTLNYPNFYSWFEKSDWAGLQYIGLLAAGIFLCLLAWYLWKRRVDDLSSYVIPLSLFIVLTVTYLLPHMHERYSFLADMIAVPFGVLYAKKYRSYLISIGIVTVSSLAYCPFLFNRRVAPMWLLSVFQLVFIVFVGMVFWKEVHRHTGSMDIEEGKNYGKRNEA